MGREGDKAVEEEAEPAAAASATSAGWRCRRGCCCCCHVARQDGSRIAQLDMAEEAEITATAGELFRSSLWPAGARARGPPSQDKHNTTRLITQYTPCLLLLSGVKRFN